MPCSWANCFSAAVVQSASVAMSARVRCQVRYCSRSQSRSMRVAPGFCAGSARGRRPGSAPCPVAGLHRRAVYLDLLPVERAAERQRRGGLAQSGQRVQHGGGPQLVAVLEVAGADLLQRLEDGVYLRGADRHQVGVPGRAGLVRAAPAIRRDRRSGASMVSEGDLNPHAGDISPDLGLNSKTGEKSPDRGVHAGHGSGHAPARVKRVSLTGRGAGLLAPSDE